jgi:Skp family chaperone for outer membrane proteins
MSKKIQKIWDRLEAIHDELESLEAEAQEYYDNRSERWQESEAASEWEDKIGTFQEAASSVQDAMDYLEEYV